MRLAVALVCLGFVFACGREERSAVPAEAPVVRAAPDSMGRLDPAPYRALIEATEALLYSGEALSNDDWTALSTEFLDLHNAIVFADDSASARETSAQLFFLSARADAIRSSSRAEIELAQVRQLWEQLSEDKFIPASWIRAQSQRPE